MMVKITPPKCFANMSHDLAEPLNFPVGQVIIIISILQKGKLRLGEEKLPKITKYNRD